MYVLIGTVQALLKGIYHPLYSMNNFVTNKSKLPQDGAQKCFLIWGDWLSRDPLIESHDSQSPHIWGDWLSCDPLRGSHDSRSPHIRT